MALTQVKSDGIATGAVTATQIAANAVTVDDIADGSISTAKLAADCVDGTKIADDAVNTEHIADDAVGADQLANTTVTAGSYGSASAIPAITVDAQGRITAASTNAISVESDRIFEGNTSAEAVDTGSDGHFKVVTEGTEALRVDSSQRVGIGETSMDGLLVIKGDSNAASMPSIRLKDGTDTREAWISNASGDLVLVNGGDDNVPHCKITLFDGNIQSFETANTERMRIDSAGNVGIRNTSPGSYSASARDLVVGNGAGQRGITIASATNNNGNIFFADGTSGNDTFRGYIQYNHNVNLLSFGTNATQQALIDSSGDFRFNSGYGSVATAYGCRAWVNFQGTGTVTIRDSGNVSSITDHAEGDYAVNFTSGMPDDDYAIVGSNVGTSTSFHCFVGSRGSQLNVATSNVRFAMRNLNGSSYDQEVVSIAIFR